MSNDRETKSSQSFQPSFNLLHPPRSLPSIHPTPPSSTPSNTLPSIFFEKYPLHLGSTFKSILMELFPNRIRANLAKFNSNQHLKPPLSHVPSLFIPPPSPKSPQSVGNLIPNSSPKFSNLRDNRSYVDVISPSKKIMEDQNRVRIVSDDVEIPSWLSRSCFGTLFSLKSMLHVCESVSNQFSGFETRVLGGDSVLITFSSLEQNFFSLDPSNIEWSRSLFSLWKE
ncbi:hypothetical protein ACFE04_004216 [Oxalis oulophora]